MAKEIREIIAMSQPEATQIEKPKVLEIPKVSEELYRKTRESLAKEGFTFVVTIERRSVSQLAEAEATRGYLGFVYQTPDIMAFVPPQMEIAIDPKNVKIKGSDNETANSKNAMIGQKEADLKGKLPADVRDIISMRMPNVSTLLQLDIKYEKQTGKPLFTNYFACTDDEVSPGNVAIVGRNDPVVRLSVGNLDRDRTLAIVFAVPVVVLPQKS